MSPVLAAVLLLQTPAAAPSPAPPDPWAAVRFMEGEWTGESEGEPGKGTVKRAYRFVLGNKFLHEQNVSTYPPQPKNEKGEVHEHWSFFSHDKARHTLVLRQFHQEGFVNQFAMKPVQPGKPGGVRQRSPRERAVHLEGARDVRGRLAGRVRGDLRAGDGRQAVRGLQQGTLQARGG